MLLCLVDVLVLRSIDPVLPGLGPVAPRPATLPRASVIDVSIASIGRLPPLTLCSTAAGGGLMKSLDAVAILLCRSSKLGEGRKS
jgi:hypothetical protein